MARALEGREGGISAFALLALPWLAAPAWTQKSKPPEPPPKVDPYTGGTPERLERLGYRSYGPFLFGPLMTDVVQSRLGDVPILWVESEHFRLGSALAEYKPKGQEEIDELKSELVELAALLDDLPTKPKKLDPWLRLHLFARRLENLYADFGARLQVAPMATSASSKSGPAASGMQKFTVLLTQKKSTLARFTRELCGVERSESHIHYFVEQGTLFYGISDESLDLSDSDLHFAVVYGVTQNLLNGIHGFPHALPAWWQHGVALWFARHREPRILLFVKPGGELLPPEELSDWEPLVRGRVEGHAYLGWPETLSRVEWANQAFGDNVVLWSRIDFLMRRPGVAPKLAELLHGPEHEVPDSTQALVSATGLDLGALDRAWCEWVEKNYRKKRK